MEKLQIEIGDNVRHKTKFLNENRPMSVSDIQNNLVQYEHFETNEEGGTSHKQSWFSFEELDKVVYGRNFENQHKQILGYQKKIGKLCYYKRIKNRI